MDLDRKNEKKTPSDKVFYKLGLYAITVTLDDKHQRFGDLLRWEKTTTYYKNMMAGIYDLYKIPYFCYFEISEPRNSKNQYGTEVQAGRVHIHGYLRFTDNAQIRNFLLYGFYMMRTNAILDIDSVNDTTIWNKYITKQQSFNNGYIDILPISNYFSLSDFMDNKTDKIKKPKITKSNNFFPITETN